MIDFELDQEQKMLTDAIRRLAEERIRKVFRDADEETDRNCHFGFFAVSGQNSVFPPELRLFSHPEQLIQSEFSGNADSKKCNSSLFLPSTPDSR